MTATVETITEQLDMAVSLPPADAPPLATAHTVTLTDTDVATATADVSDHISPETFHNWNQIFYRETDFELISGIFSVLSAS